EAFAAIAIDVIPHTEVAGTRVPDDVAVDLHKVFLLGRSFRCEQGVCWMLCELVKVLPRSGQAFYAVIINEQLLLRSNAYRLAHSSRLHFCVLLCLAGLLEYALCLPLFGQIVNVLHSYSRLRFI